MEERERTLEERVTLLEDKLRIQELEGRLKAKHEIVEQLEYKISDMEKKLKQPRNELETSTVTREPDMKSSKFQYLFETR